MLWVGFLAFVLAMLVLDLGVFQRKAHEVKVREALIWSGVWIALALAFGAGVFWFRGTEMGLEYLTAYVLEKSLSIDNLFVFLLVFGSFQVPAMLQQRVLLWGMLGALVMRAVLIFAGIDLLHRFHWVLYGFGALLVVSGLRMLRSDEVEVHPDRNPVVRALRRYLPITKDFHGKHFFERVGGKWHATPLLLALVVIETSDLVFAVDSIPAVLAVSDDPFIVYTSNVFAMLGLRSLYFALAGVIDRLHLFKYGLAAVLVFVGAKMLLADVYRIPTWAALGFVAIVLGGAALASVWVPRAKEPPTGYPSERPPQKENRDDDPGLPPHPARRAARPPRERP
ncbi:MAG: Inner rane protein alx [Cyanobacteria bacterium RYN_339]|nr:Inner rane protein alx [Cyanobacteria bacterium RYN_339]